jgi:hypothetical protein
MLRSKDFIRIAIFFFFLINCHLLTAQPTCSNPQQKWYMNYFEVDFSSGTPVFTATPNSPAPTSPSKFMNVANGYHDAGGNIDLYTVWIEQTGSSPQHVDLYDGTGTVIGTLTNLHPYAREIEVLPYTCNGMDYFLVIYNSIVTNTSGNSLVFVIVDVEEGFISSPYTIESLGFGNPPGNFALSNERDDDTYYLYANARDDIKKYVINFDFCNVAPELLIQFEETVFFGPGNIFCSEVELSPDETKIAFARRPSNEVTVVNLDTDGNAVGSMVYTLPGSFFDNHVNGVEFNRSSNKLFINNFSSNTAHRGIFVLDFNTGLLSNTVISGTFDYARSQLELAPDCYLYAGNYFSGQDENRLLRIDPETEGIVTEFVLPGRLPYQDGSIGAQYGLGDFGIFTLPDLIDCNSNECITPSFEACEPLQVSTYDFTLSGNVLYSLVLDGVVASNGEYVSFGFNFQADNGFDSYYYFSRMDASGNQIADYRKLDIDLGGAAQGPTNTEVVSPHHMMEGFDVETGSSLGYFAATTSSDEEGIIVIRFDHFGCIMWSEYFSLGEAGVQGLARGIEQNEDGNLLILLEKRSATGESNMSFVEFDPNGGLLSVKDFDLNSGENWSFSPQTIARVNNLSNVGSGFVVAGTFEAENGKELGVYILDEHLSFASPVVYRYQLQSTQEYGAIPSAVVQKGDNLVVSGVLEQTTNPTFHKSFLLEFRPFDMNGVFDGSMIWTREYGYDIAPIDVFEGTDFLSMVQNEEGNFVISAVRPIVDDGGEVSYLTEIDQSGSVNWIYAMASPSLSLAQMGDASKLKLTHDGGYWGLGNRLQSDPIQVQSWYYKTNADGELAHCDCQQLDSLPVSDLEASLTLIDVSAFEEVPGELSDLTYDCLGIEFDYALCGQYIPSIPSDECCNPDATLIENGSFSGLPGGDLVDPSGTWYASSGSPQIVNDGCNSSESLQMWGNGIVGERVEQDSLSIMAGNTYRISFCAKFLPGGPLAPPFSQILVRASGNTLQGQTGCNGGTCEEAFFTVPFSDGEWQEFCLDSWIPQDDYSHITLSVVNSSTINNGDYVSWARIDDFCIELVETIGISPCDTVSQACFVNQLNVSTGFNHEDGSTYDSQRYDAYWSLVETADLDVAVPRAACVIVPHFDATGWAFQAGSEWISFKDDYDLSVNNDGSSPPHAFERCFYLCSDEADITFDFSVLADDIVDINLLDESGSIVSNLMSLDASTAPNFSGAPATANITLPLSSGQYCIRADARNTNQVAFGFNLQGTVSGGAFLSDSCYRSENVIFGVVYSDCDVDGFRDFRLNAILPEPGRKDWEVQLCDLNGNVLHTTTTDMFGYYQFSGIPPGTYLLKEDNLDPNLVYNLTEPFSSPSGSYTVTVSDNSIAANYNFGIDDGVDCPTSYKETISRKMEVFPNPTSGMLTLRPYHISDSELEMQVANMAGQIVISSTLPALQSEYQVNVHDLHAGIYMILIMDDQGKVWHERFVKH